LSLEQSVLLCRLETHYGQNTVTSLATESGRTTHTITAMVNILEREEVQAVQQAGPELNARLGAGSIDDLIEQKLDEALRPMRALLPD